MTRSRSTVGVGVLLVLLGLWFLALQLVPGLSAWVDRMVDWPFTIIGAGAIILVIGLLVGAPAMAIPASIVAGIGLILAYQNATGNYASWAYMWALIPGFVGVGMLLAALFGDAEHRGKVQEALRTILVSAVMFLVFGAFLGGQALMGRFWPVLLIGGGILLLGLSFFKRGNAQ